ncbi:MAG: oligoribonuclease [Bdellovibrionaceae bacterium]|nr:oligoribonuclease [Pseudobdellovibrionaceae bacterium]
MTGLDVTKEKIIEVAGIITDTDFNELSEYHAVIQQDQTILDAMDDWNKTHHAKSGLLELIPSGKDQNTVEQELITWTKEFFTEERAILAGNSIGQDRLFIDNHMQDFAATLHYRLLNVTSWKIPFWVQGIEMKKRNGHRAMDDIRESIEELKFYLSYVNFSSKNK